MCARYEKTKTCKRVKEGILSLSRQNSNSEKYINIHYIVVRT